MVIYLKHPKHGTKVAISDMEAQSDIQNGWEEYNPDTPSVSESAINDAAPVNELEGKRRRKE